MIRYLLSLLLYPLVQRFVTAFLSSLFQNMQTRPNGSTGASGSAQRGETRGETSFDNEHEVIYGRVRHIVDGDSLYITRHEDQIRLWGVNAPEKHEPGYNEATQMLMQLAMDEDLKVQVVAIDKYGRTLGRCFFQDGRELNYELIKSGKVKEYMRFTKGFYSN